MSESHRVVLAGCHPEPLAGYLKSLGLFRVVAQQVDSAARASWSTDGFILESSLDQPALLKFLCDAYRPAPIVSPWNGGSGFFPKDNTEALRLILASDDERVATYRDLIEQIQVIGPMPEGIDKSTYLMQLRNELPDYALDWLEAAFVLTADGSGKNTPGVRYPALLGTGGNDGRLDFSNNYMQRVVDVLALGPVKAAHTARVARWAEMALFAGGQEPLLDAAIGQFDPGGAGGSNSSPQGKGKSLVNPWDFVLMIEGTLVFSGASVRRRGQDASRASLPFTFQRTESGFGSAAEEEGRQEIWAPLWDSSATLGSVQALFSEGRMSVGSNVARSALDAARAVATLGHDRQIGQFVRYAIVQRFGLSNVAVPIGRIAAPAEVRLATSLSTAFDSWLWKPRSLKSAAIKSAVRTVDAAAMNLALGSVEPALGAVELLRSIASLERFVSRSRSARDEISPVRRQLAADWKQVLRPLLVDSVEARIAWALASGRSRSKVEPSALREFALSISGTAWTDRPPVDGFSNQPIQHWLAAVSQRREWSNEAKELTEKSDEQDRKGARVAFPFGGSIDERDALLMVRGLVNGERIREYLEGFFILDFQLGDGIQPPSLRAFVPTAFEAALLAHCGPKRPAIPSPFGLARQLGTFTNLQEAERSLSRSVRIEGYEPMISAPVNTANGPWLAAALLLNVRSSGTPLIERAGARYASKESVESTESTEATADPGTHLLNQLTTEGR
jgi:CRISPR-associated protein Csx17